MTKRRLCFTFFLLICFSLPLIATAQTVTIPDSNLVNAIWNDLGYLPDGPIPASKMAKLKELTARNRNITDLTGLEAATNLTRLNLDNNSISDISALENLTNLTSISLSGNSIADISPLVANTGLGRGDMVDVTDNPLNDAAINTHIPALQSRGVTVDFSVNIPDSNLHNAIWNDLGYLPDGSIPASKMANLTKLEAPNANIRDLTGLEYATNLTALFLEGNSISDISPLAGLNNLTQLHLWDNAISDISPLAGLTNLTWLVLADNAISDISPLAELTNLTELYLGGNSISDTSPVEGLTQLTRLDLDSNAISDISAVAGLTNLTALFLEGNSISDISPLAGLNNLTQLYLWDNAISDISPLANLTSLEDLQLGVNAISDISPLANLTSLENLSLWNNSISDILPLARLNNLRWLHLERNAISDISPLIANTGLGNGDVVDVGENPLNYASINTHIPALRSRGVEVRAVNLKPAMSEYTLSIPAGISLVHVPLRVTEVDGVEQSIESISDLYEVLGGEDNVIYLFTRDAQAEQWVGYFNPTTSTDRELTDDMGIITRLIKSVSIRLTGNPLGIDGNSTITLHRGVNLVGLPLRDSSITHVSDLFDLEGIVNNVLVIMFQDNEAFKRITPTDHSGDIEVTGGQSFLLIVQQRPATIPISGEGWTNPAGIAAAPPVTLKGVEVGDTTPVLGLRGAIVDEGTGLKAEDFRVTVKNLSTGRAAAAVTSPDEAAYRLAIVDIETGRAAQIGDILEISAQSPNPFVGVEPLRYGVTAEDVEQSLIQLPELAAYEIPAETELLCNYPNPFNPETWIPYRLAEEAFVTLTIYDGNGQVVRTIDVGHQAAAVYENRSKAIYWDGRNGLGEQVASGVYFYHLSAGDYSATRKMLILK